MASARCESSVCVVLIAVVLMLVQLRILTNQYTVLPAAAGYLAPAGAPGSAQSHGFTATIGVQLPTYSCPCTATCMLPRVLRCQVLTSIWHLKHSTALLADLLCRFAQHDSPDAVIS
jgi:hypothetical protein